MFIDGKVILIWFKLNFSGDSLLHGILELLVTISTTNMYITLVKSKRIESTHRYVLRKEKY